ncbi:MAG: UPF0262 family protein [Hyphomicrobiales bacterium]|nr:UPF0262 family protein [Hyphomicrobiales bacterium]
MGEAPKQGGAGGDARRLVRVALDEATIGRAVAEIEHEREVAIYDLLECNEFALVGGGKGPYELTLSIIDRRLVFQVAARRGKEMSFILSLAPFRRIVKDYFLVCESYYRAIKTAPPSHIEAIDMGRRGLHDEGTQILIDRLKGKIEVDYETARRLFTLICVLHWKG